MATGYIDVGNKITEILKLRNRHLFAFLLVLVVNWLVYRHFIVTRFNWVTEFLLIFLLAYLTGTLMHKLMKRIEKEKKVNC